MDRDKVAEILGCEIPDGWWIRYCNVIKFTADFPVKTPSKTQSFNRIKKLHKSLHKTLKILDSLFPSEEGTIILAEGDSEKDFDRYCEAKENIAWLKDKTAKALERIESRYFETKSGPRKGLPLKMLILNLSALYESLTGKRPTVSYDPYNETYGGRFLAFVELSCQYARLEYQSRSALAKIIQRL